MNDIEQQKSQGKGSAFIDARDVPYFRDSYQPPTAQPPPPPPVMQGPQVMQPYPINTQPGPINNQPNPFFIQQPNSGMPQFQGGMAQDPSLVYQTSPIIIVNNPGYAPCPFCHRAVPTIPKRVTSQTQIFWCVIVTFFAPLFCCIPFCMESCDDVHHQCSGCGKVVSTNIRPIC